LKNKSSSEKQEMHQNIKEEAAQVLDDSYDVCQTAACNEEGSFLAKLLNWSENPCNNFYKFVCDKWTHDVSISEESFDKLVVKDIKTGILQQLKLQDSNSTHPLSLPR